MTALLRPAPRPTRPAAPSRPRLRTVEQPTARPRARRSLSARPRLVAAGVAFALVLAGNVSVHAATTQGQFKLEQLRDSAGRKQADYQQLRLAVAELAAPDRIVEQARQLGMVEPAKVTVLTPTADTSAPGPTTTTAATAADPQEAAQSWGRVKQHLGPRP